MIFSATLSLALASLAAAGPCDLLDRAAVTQLLGTPVTKVEPSGPEADEDSGGTRTTCTYSAGQAMLIVIRLDFPDAATAGGMASAELEPGKLAEEKATAKPEAGLGDKAWLIRAPAAIEYVVVKGPTVLTLALGGVPKPLATYEAQLRTSATAATAKL